MVVVGSGRYGAARSVRGNTRVDMKMGTECVVSRSDENKCAKVEIGSTPIMCKSRYLTQGPWRFDMSVTVSYKGHCISSHTDCT